MGNFNVSQEISYAGLEFVKKLTQDIEEYVRQHVVQAGVEIAEVDLGALLMSPKLWACGE